MKKRNLSLMLILSMLLTLVLGFTSFAANGEKRLFDDAGLLTQEEAADIEKGLDYLSSSFGHDFAIYTTNGHDQSKSVDKVCDLFYYNNKLGAGDGERSGSLLFLDMVTRDIYIYAQGEAAMYFTDADIQNVLYNYNGGIVGELQREDYHGAFVKYMSTVESLYASGVAENQYSEYAGGLVRVYADGRKKVILWPLQWIIAIVISGLTGIIPMNNVKKKYAMVAEKRSAERVSLAYRSTAQFAFTGAALGVTRSRIPIVQAAPPSSGGSGGSHHSSGGGFSGGGSTMHHSTGGGHHSGGGGKF
ncbi:MAG: TPM domain-containing protein [Eubacteriales bacterium]|nr:TPM domain-containing protein [Eubacteriales bacterium]